MVHPEQRVTGAGDAIVHLAADAGVARAVRRGRVGGCALEARPRGGEVLLVHADVDLGLRRSLAPGVADLAVDAVARHLVAWAEGIVIVSKGPCRDAIPSP